MNRTYEEWLKYYENATKEQVIEDMMLDIKEIQRLNNRIDKAIEDINKLISGCYAEGKGDVAEGYMASPCCNIRLEIIKKDLLGEDD